PQKGKIRPDGIDRTLTVQEQKFEFQEAEERRLAGKSHDTNHKTGD
ncbi:16539_t:CDS:1, partial [Rhizophagus irregularis]